MSSDDSSATDYPLPVGAQWANGTSHLKRTSQPGRTDLQFFGAAKTSANQCLTTNDTRATNRAANSTKRRLPHRLSAIISSQDDKMFTLQASFNSRPDSSPLRKRKKMTKAKLQAFVLFARLRNPLRRTAPYPENRRGELKNDARSNGSAAGWFCDVARLVERHLEKGSNSNVVASTR
uniref:Uncharacterized protein n=1 Tax=Trichuris muris TaxID=70415 RepID=A0A5S6QWN7_TRIMR